MLSNKRQQILYQNRWYQIVRNHNDTLNFQSGDGQRTLVKSIHLYSEFLINDRLFTINQKLQYDIKDDHLTDEFTVCCKNSACVTNIKICCDPHFSTVRFSILSNFLLNLKIVRHAILFDFDISLRTLIKKNRQIQERDFPKRAWLDRQGAIFGDGSNSAFIYHTPGISSLETISDKNRLIVNLDYQKDHPQVMSNSDGGYLDRSHSCFSSGDETSYHFSIGLGYQLPFFLRFMAAPRGFLATHVWAEHACHSDLRVHRALYYGSETIENSAKAEAGFVKHGIPVTKSVFFNNEAEIKNEDPSEVFNRPMVSIKGSSDFSLFLNDLQKIGHYDICLHCAQPQSSTPEECKEALEYMKKNFDSVCWIDHLWYRSNDTKGCREAMNCEGLDTTSPYYMKPLWLRYGIKYFWSYSAELLKDPEPWRAQRRLPYRSALFEMLRSGKYINAVLYTVYKFRSKLNGIRGASPKAKPMTLNLWDISNDNPNPVYWVHPTLGHSSENSNTAAGQVYLWATRASYFPGAEKQDPYTEKGLNSLIREWGVCLSHAYPVSVYLGDHTAAWHIDHDGKVVISRHFDSILTKMSKLHKDGLLHLTTIRGIMDYWIKLGKMEIEYRPLENAARIYNYNSEIVEEVAFVFEGTEIFVNGRRPQLKRVDEEIIFWFDIDPLTYTTISSKREHSEGQGKILSRTMVDDSIIR